MSVKQKFIDSLVEDWKDAYKWLSVQAIFLLTTVATLTELFPAEWDQIKDALPDPVRKVALTVVGVALIYARLKAPRAKADTKGIDDE